MGDGAKDKGARNKLIEENQGLVLFVANQYTGYDADFEDLASVGMIGLIKAADTFRPENNVKFATYAASCIWNEICMYLRQIQKYKREISLDSIVRVDKNGNKLYFSDILGTEPDVVTKRLEEEADRDILMSALSALPEQEQVLIRLLFGMDGQDCDGRTQTEAGKQMGISSSSVYRIKNRALRHLRSELMRLAG